VRSNHKIRLDRLEQAIAPRGCIFVFFMDGTPPDIAEQLAAFKTKNRVGPHDTLIEVIFTFSG
jgi:hypothetical protein